MTKIFLLIVSIYLFSGCTLLQKSPAPISVYDFGSQLSQHPEPAQQQSSHQRRILIADASAPSWLNNNAMHYRLLFNNPTQSYTYARSRWIAPPASVVTQQIRNRIVTHANGLVVKENGTAKADYILQIELEEFMQAFDQANDSHVVILLRASLIERNSRQLLAQKDFSIQQKTPSADAAGAAFAFSSASNQLVSKLTDWLAIQLPAN